MTSRNSQSPRLPRPTWSIMNNDVDGYECNAAVILLKQINRVLDQQLFEESADGMVRLGSKSPNTLTRYKFNVAIKKSDVKKQSIAKAATASTTDSVVALEITTNSDAQDESDIQNSARLVAIGVKEAITEDIMVIMGDHITKPHPQDDRRVVFQNGRKIRSPPAAQCSHQRSQTTVCHSNQADDGERDSNII